MCPISKATAAKKIPEERIFVGTTRADSCDIDDCAAALWRTAVEEWNSEDICMHEHAQKIRGLSEMRTN